MTDHANELRRHARKIPHPQGETPGVMLRAADEIECLRAKVEAAEKERDWHAERCEDAMNECDALRAKITEMEKQEPFDADSPEFRRAFDAALKTGHWPLERKNFGYRSTMSQMAWQVAFCTVNNLGSPE